MARWRAAMALTVLALLLAVVLLAVPSVRAALPGMTQRAEYTNLFSTRATIVALRRRATP